MSPIWVPAAELACQRSWRDRLLCGLGSVARSSPEAAKRGAGGGGLEGVAAPRLGSPVSRLYSWPLREKNLGEARGSASGNIPDEAMRDDATAWSEGVTLAHHAGKAVIFGSPHVGADLHGLANAGYGFLLKSVGEDGRVVAKQSVAVNANARVVGRSGGIIDFFERLPVAQTATVGVCG